MHNGETTTKKLTDAIFSDSTSLATVHIQPGAVKLVL